MIMENIQKSSVTPDLFFSLKNKFSIRCKRNDENILYSAGSTQITSITDNSIGELHLSTGYIREPHWHNTGELNRLVSGSASIGTLDPNTHEIYIYRLTKPGDVVFIPMGWLHWVTGNQDNTQIQLTFNNSILETTELSDVLRLTPLKIFQLAYGMDIENLNKLVSPITETVIIGPAK
ncbi:TPA: cupin domain-containing protein [Bacillus cereus]|nr:cupin domain-containing protein [Bacillus cereus]